jgi:hypothetical protein
MTAIADVAQCADRRAQSRSRFAGWLARAVAILKNLGPYAAIEILLPGGTLIALLLWLHRRRWMLPDALKAPLSLRTSS